MLDLAASNPYRRRMRGEVERQGMMLTLVQPEQRIPADHPIRRIKALADAELDRSGPQRSVAPRPPSRAASR
jgi:hypothetical protein